MKGYMGRLKQSNIWKAGALCLLLLAGGHAYGQQNIYRVSLNGEGDGSSWSSTISLADALDKAVAGDQIWVQGDTESTQREKHYVVPVDAKGTGFTLKSGVKLYGGFAGTETSIEQRETLGKPYQFKCPTVLSGDIKGDDTVDNVNLIFPANTTRSDNAAHVLTLNMEPTQASGNNNTYPTVVDGFTIAGGHATDTGSNMGGGILVTGNNSGGGIYRIERCFLLNNYAEEGGAIYVSDAVKDINNNTCLINQCAVYNNAAGERSTTENAGGGIWIGGAGTVVNTAVFNNENGGLCLSAEASVVNCTVARNTSGGIDALSSASIPEVHNTVIWGNTTLFAEFSPEFHHSAYHEATDADAGNGNIYVSDKNRDAAEVPMFESPSSRTSFDRDFNWMQDAYPLWSWSLLEGSWLIDKGNDAAYAAGVYGDMDLAGMARVSGGLDIGAYEFQQIPASRIRYVKQNATGTGDGSSWENASSDLQAMIDALADNNPQNQPGEVWVATGIYEPQRQIISGTAYSASFRMRDNISVYGGFDGNETTKDDRAKTADGMPWQFENETILSGAAYNPDTNLQWSNNRWSVTSDSRHVVWFAPMPDEGKDAFSNVTILNGVTIQGGYAQGGLGLDDFKTDCGAGVYMGRNAYLTNCVVRANSATGNGGAVYLDGGRVLNSLVYNNNAEANGGGVYVNNGGIVLASMMTNNSADNGAGVYLAHTGEWIDGHEHPEYLILSTSVISNNTARLNGAVYCAKGGVLLQNTIVNNSCPTATDNTASNASQTGGLYIDTYALVVNSVLWGNDIQERDVPMYARNPSVDKVRFMYTALSGTNNAVWNNTLQQEMIQLSDNNDSADESAVLTPDFAGGMPDDAGVDGSLTEVSYFWAPAANGSNLRARGMTLGTLPTEVLLAPELDIEGNLFAQKPAVGAYAVTQTAIQPQDTGDALIVYVDAECTVASHNGSSWTEAYRSLNEAVAYLASLSKDEVGSKRLEVHVCEGDLWPRFAFTNLDPKTATVSIPATASGAPLYIYGGYSRSTRDRNPLLYRSMINGNHEGKAMEDGLYHCITVADGANVVLDGFHVLNGYAAGEASVQYGAGMLVLGDATVTVQNSIFENNTALEGAAIDARDATLTLTNCVVNNNTNRTETESVINCSNLTLNHVTVVNNIGAAPSQMGGSSFSAGNTSGNSKELAVNQANFANPTNKQGATLGFDTYFGGYSNFTPNTSSADAGALINKATGSPSELTTDIAGNERSLGGMPDLGAYEANLPKNGSVIYVTATGAGNKDGSSWENAIAGNEIYDLTQSQSINVLTGDNRYIGFYDANSRPYGETSGASKLFFEHMGEEGVINGTAVDNVAYEWETHNGVTHVTGASKVDICNERDERYVGGLQYAVERAAASATDDTRVQVWVAGGTYTDYKGFVIRDKVEVLGGFPNEGTPGLDDRHPLVSQYIPTNEESEGLTVDTYETILQVQGLNPIDNANSLPERTRKPVLFQPDVCLPTKSPSGRESSFSYWEWHDGFLGIGRGWENHGYGSSVPETTDDGLSNTYRWESQEGGYVEYEGAIWDGFTIRHGFYTDYQANRDGGAGVRMFRGVTLQNCVVTENYYGADNCSRGAGIYCDGANSMVINCFILNNRNEGNESYGGGMYMILGTGYNNLVANNYAGSNGGGIYIEAATFYNNTIAYNRSDATGDKQEGTGGLHQYYSDQYSGSNLHLYNCLFYGNQRGALGFEDVTKFNGAHYCYVQSETALSTDIRNRLHNSVYGTDLDNPFELGNGAQAANNFRLNGTTLCLNHGTDDLGQDALGNAIVLPETDVDFTTRIKDCTVDIGAYERNNQDNVEPDGNGVYYVTQNGAGTANGSSLDNAACAMKLQEVLNAAGERAKTGQTAIVKLAGYKSNSFTYHANTLSNPDDPQSYTYVIPYGVTVMGGYNEADADSWSNDTRNAVQFMTVLSAIYEPTSATAESVNGYHVVTFGERPDGWTGADKRTILDGVYLEDGKATSMAGTGNPNTRGGGAIVPAWAHVRNCVVRNCEAIEGGGLYVMPGGIVSGCGVMRNTAETGAGIYANGEGVGESNRAHLVSSTVTDNTATSTGGGLYLEDGAMMVSNSVLWGNTAPSDKNVSGVLSQTFDDEVWTAVEPGIEPGIEGGRFYPVNHSFVETYEMPSNFENTAMESDESIYFANDFRILKAYSPLIKHGMDTKYQTNMQTALGIAEHDMQGIERAQKDMNRVDAGAYAFDGGMIPTDVLITRIFVSQGANELSEGTSMDNYIGRTFYTSLTWLDDALEYIRTVRSNGTATADTKFEILLAQGTYKPSYRRTDAATSTVSQRQNSYVIPQGVSIYGGFSGEEMISSSGITSVPGVSGTFTADGDINGILDARAWSDFNQNGIAESWELTNQTILSGKVNTSENERNVYHVLYADAKDRKNPIVLDGLTVMEGETVTELSADADNNEVGRGAGLYSNGVPVVVNRCRFINNYAVRGGAIYVRNADLSVLGSIVAGNGPVEGCAEMDAAGGAVYLSGSGKKYMLRAVNTLWVNNETAGRGGAIAVGQNGLSVSVSLMNNTFARNKAGNGESVASLGSGTNTITNTAMWGNEGTTGLLSGKVTVSHSAADADLTGDANIKLAADNMSVNGPRFAKPSDKAGVAGNDATNQWNPAAISVLTDGGDGEGIANPPTGAYETWWVGNDLNTYKEQYMGDINYARYAGPLDDNGAVTKKPIDIGVYEYQYKPAFADLDIVYVATQESGNGSGDSWANATSDLRGAIVAMANPTGGQNTDKEVRIRNGEYSMPRLSAGDAYSLIMATSKDYGTSLTIRGSYNASGVQDYANPTVITTHEQSVNSTDRLFNVQTSGKPVTMDGLSFINKRTDGGLGMEAQVDDDSSLALTHVAFRVNDGGALKLTGDGQTLIANALFADSQGTGLDVTSSTDNVTVVNATFANNGTDMSDGLTKVYNTVSWKNGTQHLVSDNSNVAIASNTENDDMQAGPNFVNPDDDEVLSRDYHIYPSLTLLNKGDDEAYTTHVLAGDETLLANEKDLGGTTRQVNKNIDVGAYEYAAPLQSVVYVKDGVVGGNGSGNSWANAIDGRDLQGAVNLAGIYAQGKSEGTTTTGIVFVHRNVTLNTPLNVSLGNTKVYGGMNDETGNNAADILGKRLGLLTASEHSTLNGALHLAAKGSVVDGFELTGTATIENGMLSTSIVKPGATLNGGILYNTLLEGSVTGTGEVVNVTATGTLPSDAKNSRASVTGDNTYVTEGYWAYQLMETSTDIDKGNTQDITKYMTLAGHEKDISGTSRVRNKVDNGCFETWNITKTAEAPEVTADDRPTGKHVVYVRAGQELAIVADVYPDGGTAFNPGFLLLEHRAGLRGNGNHIDLTNFAVERNVPASGSDLAYMPFVVTKTENAGNVTMQEYNSEARAAYYYKFNGEESAWQDVTTYAGNAGVLLENTAGSEACVRFYGKSYTEDASGKSVKLTQYNFREPWRDNSKEGNRFTHKENMGWNLFGSPYLCAMNYADMEYGRMIYGTTEYTPVDTEDAAEGHVPAGDAVFTQTATLKTEETFSVEHPAIASGAAYQTADGDLTLALSSDSGTDVLRLHAVDDADASVEFDMASDGVKWMNPDPSVPQIYAGRNGGRYSLLSAVGRENGAAIGIRTSQAGNYVISVLDTCDTSAYEAVMLADAHTHAVTDLLESPYTFSLSAGGDVENRFTVNFVRMDEERTDGIRIYSPAYGQIAVEGIASGYVLRLYDVTGRLVETRVATAERETFGALPRGIYLVQVLDADKKPQKTGKVSVL